MKKFHLFDVVEFTDIKGGYGIFSGYINMDEALKEAIKHVPTKPGENKKESDEALLKLSKDLGFDKMFKDQWCKVLVGNPSKPDEWQEIEVETENLKIAVIPTMRFRKFLSEKAEELKKGLKQNESKSK